MNNPCIFCEIIAGRAAVSPLYEDDDILAFMDIRPVNTGHLLLIPKEHHPYTATVPPAILGHMMKTGNRLATALRKSGLPCEGINFFLADGKAAGQEVFHSHLHIIPRFKGDGFGFRFPEGFGYNPARKKLDEVASLIKQHLD